MIHFLHKSAKDAVGREKTVAGLATRGDIEVILSGKQLDRELVPLACLLAKKLGPHCLLVGGMCWVLAVLRRR
jgi:hypothetical protein